MRRCNDFLPTVLRGLGALVMTFCLFTGFRADAAALDVRPFSVTILSEDASRISYSIAASDRGKSVVAVTATYRKGQLRETYIDPFTTDAEVHTRSMLVTKTFDDFKVMLLDGTTYAPLCSSGGYRTVRFLDSDGALLSEQRILSGHTAQPPETAKRDGWLFLGWSRKYEAVFDDLELTARYVQENSANLFMVTSASAGAGEEVSVRLKLSGTVELCGFDLRLRYDAEALEWLGMDAEQDFDVTANHVAAGHYIRLNYSSRENKTAGGDIVEVTFRVRDAGREQTALALEAISVIGIDPADANSLRPVDYSVIEGVVRIV